MALGEIDSPDVYDPLVEVYKKGEQDTAFFAAIALGRHGDPKAADVLISGRASMNQFITPAVCLSLAMMNAFDKLDYVKEAYFNSSANEEKTVRCPISWNAGWN